MSDNHHVSEYLTDLFDCIFSCFMLKQWNENIFEPIAVKSLFLLVCLENSQDTWILKLSEPSFHEFKELWFHFFTEDFICRFIVSQEQVFKITGIKFIYFLFNLGIHFYPEFLMFATKLFHKMVKLHQVYCFNFFEILIDILESLTYPWMLIPVM